MLVRSLPPKASLKYWETELNPIERVWEYLKQDLKWELFDNLEHLRTKVSQLLAELTPEIAASFNQLGVWKGI
ncbi:MULTISPECIES: hypothetical protein [Nostoc]|uniref:Transposase n=2 Tax=Nostoc TaxID=1177 RepID=A0ABR8I522_9NOSO|nr:MULTISPECIES: hypothetical protein [Nostoc]MBD2560226.1 hypothetical protein [Nostoc linckia FACHB-391]MBD2645881.1 hypothetical protein [Nostoc foliaceum FACHB-393]